MQQASSSLLGAASAATTFYRAQVLEGDYSVYEYGQQPPFQQKRQLDVLPISAYCWDSGLPPGSGRLIAVNRSYVCYCLRSSGFIRILGRNAPSCGLFQGHTQRVTDMEFFAEDVNLVASVSLDARLYVWRIVGNVGGKDDFQLQQHVILAIHFDGSWKDVFPRVCWHPHSQEILMVCMSNRIFKIDVEKARSKASQLKLSEEASLSCSTTNLIDGISCVGQHDAEVTDLSIFTEDVLYVASACNDGMVRIWEDCKESPLAVLMPHDGQPVGSVFFLTCDSQPDRVALLTSDSTNKRLKLWVPCAPSCRFCTWDLVQTLEFKRCDGVFAEKLFSNRICTVPQAGLVLLGNSGSPSLYSVQLKFGGALNEVQMNYLTEFSLSMPILSLTAVTETGSSSCKDMAHIFCVQTQAIQEYCLNISDCLIPQCNESALVSKSGALPEADLIKISVCKAVEGEQESKRPDMTAKEMVELATGNSNSGSGFGSWVEVPNWIAATVKRNPNTVTPLASVHGAGSVKLLMEDQELLSRSAGDVCASLSTLPSLSLMPTSPGYSKMVANVLLPIELDALPSGMVSESWKHDVTASDSVSKQLLNTFHDHQESESTREEEAHMILQGSRTISGSESTADRHTVITSCGVELEHFKGGTTIANATVVMEEIKDGLLSAVKAKYNEHHEELDRPDLENPSNKFKKKRTRRRRKSLGFRVSKGKYREHQEELGLPELESPSNNLKRKSTRRRKGLGFGVAKGKHKEHQQTDLESTSNNSKRKRTRRRRKRSATMNRGATTLFSSKLASQIVQNACISPSINGEDLSEQLLAIRESVNHLLTTQMEFQKSFYTVIDVPLSHEVELIDAFQEGWIRKYLSSYWDTILRHIAERSNQNSLWFEWTGQLQKAFDEFFSKDFSFTPTFMLTSEVLSCIESNISMPVSSSVDRSLMTSLPQVLEGWNKDFYRYVEKSLDTILNTSLREQMESVFIGWKHLIQEEIFRKQALLKVEQTCENMIRHGHCLSAEGILPHLCILEQHVNCTVLALLSSLKGSLLSVSCIADSFNEVLHITEKNSRKSTEHQSRANHNFHKEITQLLQQGHLEDAFTMALSLGNSSVTSWICKQVDLRTFFGATSPPLSQGVILLLLQQLAVDVGHESNDKLAWMEQACLALVPNNHPDLCMRSSLEQVYMLLQRQSPLFTSNVKLANQARLVMHLLNSLMAFCS